MEICPKTAINFFQPLGHMIRVNTQLKNLQEQWKIRWELLSNCFEHFNYTQDYV